MASCVRPRDEDAGNLEVRNDQTGSLRVPIHCPETPFGRPGQYYDGDGAIEAGYTLAVPYFGLKNGVHLWGHHCFAAGGIYSRPTGSFRPRQVRLLSQQTHS